VFRDFNFSTSGGDTPTPSGSTTQGGTSGGGSDHGDMD